MIKGPKGKCKRAAEAANEKIKGSELQMIKGTASGSNERDRPQGRKTMYKAWKGTVTGRNGETSQISPLAVGSLSRGQNSEESGSGLFVLRPSLVLTVLYSDGRGARPTKTQ